MACVKGRDWQRLMKESVLPSLPDLVLATRFVYHPDAQWLLRGISKGGSSFSDGLRLSAFVQPLYVPKEYVTIDYSVGLNPRGFGDAKLWSPTDPNLASEVTACIREQALPFLASIETPADLMEVAYARLTAGSVVDPNILACVAYSAVLSDEDSRVRECMSFVDSVDLCPGWVTEVTDQVRQLLLVWTADTAKAKAMLLGWRNHTAAALKLPLL